MSRHRHPTTIAATIAQFRDQAPPRFKENAAVMKYVMQFFETGVLTGIGLVRDIDELPEPERTAALVDLRTEHDTAVMTNFSNAVHDMVDLPTSPQARSGQYRAGAGPTSQFVPADSADGTPESTAYEELLAKLAASPLESPQAREIVPSEAREIVKSAARAGNAKEGVMGAWAYCTNEDCQRGFDRPSFAEITARKRECPACGQINHVADDLGEALDEKSEEIVTAGSHLVAPAVPLHGSRPSVFIADDPEVAAGTIVPPQVPLILGEAPRKTASQVTAENLDSTIAALRGTFGTNTGRFSATSANASDKPQPFVAAGQEANTAFVGTLTYSVSGIAELRLADGVALPPGHYTISLTKES